MSIVLRQVLLGTGMALIVFLIVISGTITAFPHLSWSDLWGRGAFDTPFILLVPSVSIVIGILFGIISGYIGGNSFNQSMVGFTRLRKGDH